MANLAGGVGVAGLACGASDAGRALPLLREGRSARRRGHRLTRRFTPRRALPSCRGSLVVGRGLRRLLSCRGVVVGASLVLRERDPGERDDDCSPDGGKELDLPAGRRPEWCTGSDETPDCDDEAELERRRGNVQRRNRLGRPALGPDREAGCSRTGPSAEDRDIPGCTGRQQPCRRRGEQEDRPHSLRQRGGEEQQAEGDVLLEMWPDDSCVNRCRPDREQRRRDRELGSRSARRWESGGPSNPPRP